MWSVGVVVLVVILLIAIEPTRKILRHLFFNPRVNSIATLLFLVLFIVSTAVGAPDFPLAIQILWGVAIIDCLFDIIKADDYYEKLTDYSKDSSYATKSIVSFFTFGLVRVIFLIARLPVILRNLFFYPRVNSIISLIILAFAIVMTTVFIENFPIVIAIKILWGIAIIDCIRDIIKADDYYDRLTNYSDDFLSNGRYSSYAKKSYHKDSFYAKKSIISLLTLGLARVVYLFVISLIFHISAAARVSSIKNDKAVLYYNLHPNGCSTYYDYILNGKINSGINKGSIVSDDSFSSSALYMDKKFFEYSKKRIRQSIEEYGILSSEYILLLDEMQDLFDLPNIYWGNRHTVFSKISNMVLGGLEQDGIIVNLDSDVYLDVRFFKYCKQRVENTMEEKGVLSPKDISSLKELQDLFRFTTVPLDRWTPDYFTLLVLEVLVKDGIIIKESFSDNPDEPFQYRHIQGKPMLSREGPPL